MARIVVLLALGTTAIALTVTSAALLFVLAASPSIKHRDTFALILAAAIIENVICLPWLLLVLRCRLILNLFARECKTRGLRRVLLIPICALALSLAAAAVVGAAMGQLTSRHNVIKEGEPILGFPMITVVVWAVSVLAQGIFLVSFILALKTTTETSALQQHLVIDDAPQEMKKASRPATATTIQSNPFHETAPSSLPSSSASDADSSLRSSFSAIQRPGSSKRMPLIRSHSQPRHSARSSSDGPSRRPSQDEAFDSWDTSGVSSQMRETVLQSKPPGKGTGLPTIPGSRSPSPAKALEGPFFDLSPEHSPPRSPLPQPPVSRPTSPPSSPLELPNYTVLFPPAKSTPPSSPPLSSPSQRQRVSRPPSLPIARSSEDHIHPLFRTSSSTPPPSASSNTNVTAAPEAGQFVNQRTFHRLRSGSLPPTSSPLVRSESSPDIRNVRAPLSPVSVNLPSPAVKSCKGASHERKRSASFETAIIRD